jgi:hypothetical protein
MLVRQVQQDQLDFVGRLKGRIVVRRIANVTITVQFASELAKAARHRFLERVGQISVAGLESASQAFVTGVKKDNHMGLEEELGVTANGSGRGAARQLVVKAPAVVKDPQKGKEQDTASYREAWKMHNETPHQGGLLGDRELGNKREKDTHRHKRLFLFRRVCASKIGLTVNSAGLSG